MLKVMMQIAIPPNDIGSRGAIQYAAEIAEAFEEYGIRIAPTGDYEPRAIEAAIEEMARVDRSTVS